MRKLISKLFKEKFQHSFEIENEVLFASIKSKNRNVLKTISNWLPEEQLKKSYFDYGVPYEIRNLLNLDIGEETTYTDLLAYYSRGLDKINYLELGVSVGKNFLQLINQFENANVTGFDVENINTVLANKMELLNKKEWETLPQSIRKETSTLETFSYKTNTVHYLAGDIWDTRSWEKLQNEKFNIIFSDALHDPKALMWEYKMIKKYDLLADDFIFMWDDLNHGLEESFKTIAADIRKTRKIGPDKVYLLKINGWLGKNFPLKHDVGIISNLKLK